MPKSVFRGFVVLWLLASGDLCAHSVVVEQPLLILPTARVDPASFMTLQREDFAAGEAEVHAVFVDLARPTESDPQGRGAPLAVFPYPGHHPVSTIEVQVAVRENP